MVDYKDILNASKSKKALKSGTNVVEIGKTDLDALRNKLGVPETDAIVVGKICHQTGEKGIFIFTRK